jgi:hypothetical protein
MLQDRFWVIALSEHAENRLLRKPVCLYARIPASTSEVIDWLLRNILMMYSNKQRSTGRLLLKQNVVNSKTGRLLLRKYFS